MEATTHEQTGSRKWDDAIADRGVRAAVASPARSKAYAGKTTAYEYGADGARLKKIETDPITTAQDVTPYAGSLETRHWGQG